MAKATVHTSLIRPLMRTKSTSGGNKMRGFTFMALITSWGGGTHDAISVFFSENNLQSVERKLFSIHQRWSGHRTCSGSERCSRRLYPPDSLGRSESLKISFSFEASIGGRPVLPLGSIPKAGCRKIVCHTLARGWKPNEENNFLLKYSDDNLLNPVSSSEANPTVTAMKMIFWTVSRSVMYRLRSDWASRRTTEYRSLKRDIRRVWREELVSWALVGDVLLLGLEERLSPDMGLDERLLLNLGGTTDTNTYRPQQVFLPVCPAVVYLRCSMAFSSLK